jgi:hypothetical protein
MKTSEVFKRSIQQYLDGVAGVNSVFAEKLKNPKKNIDDCLTYILNQVKKSGMNGMEDSEVYGMAMHYYDEEDIKVGSPVNAQVIVNHEVKLTPEEIVELKEKAREKVIADEVARIKKKPAKTETKKNSGDSAIGTLF